MHIFAAAMHTIERRMRWIERTELSIQNIRWTHLPLFPPLVAWWCCCWWHQYRRKWRLKMWKHAPLCHAMSSPNSAPFLISTVKMLHTSPHPWSIPTSICDDTFYSLCALAPGSKREAHLKKEYCGCFICKGCNAESAVRSGRSGVEARNLPRYVDSPVCLFCTPPVCTIASCVYLSYTSHVPVPPLCVPLLINQKL